MIIAFSNNIQHAIITKVINMIEQQLA